MQRAQRKLEHIRYALELGDGPCSTHLEDIRFLHNCLPEINPADINLSVEIFGKQLSLPFFIDAITGGTDAVTEINAQLAQVAVRTGSGLAVGSQYGAVKSGEGLGSYAIIRQFDPSGPVFANISALATPQQAQAAVDMLKADALEIHLNTAQELFMPEGDRDFRGLLDNMINIRKNISVPVIVKETGCGIGAEQYHLLQQSGFTNFNCAGAGGTNFVAIEARRADIEPGEFACWGLPTCWSMLDAASCVQPHNLLLASGGIRTAGDAARALALGADAVGITGAILQRIVSGGVAEAIAYLEDMAQELKKYMLLLGCRSPKDLRRVPLMLTGETKDFAQCRGISLADICKGRRRQIVIK